MNLSFPNKTHHQLSMRQAEHIYGHHTTTVITKWCCELKQLNQSVFRAPVIKVNYRYYE